MLRVTAAITVGALMLTTAGAGAQTTDAHIAKARAAAGQDHIGLFDRLCTPPAPPSPRPAVDGPKGPSLQVSNARSGPPDRSTWHAEPMKIFDNLYFVGEKEYSAWAVRTSEGIILIDAIFHYSVDEQVVQGLTKLGLDPKTIKYVVISHGHGDHAAGARHLQDRFSARILASEADCSTGSTGSTGSTESSYPRRPRVIVRIVLAPG